MINRPIGFEVVYREAGEFKREPVAALKMKLGNVLEVQTESEKVLPFDPMETTLFQFTGEFDEVSAPIFHGHILTDKEGNQYEVVFYGGGFHLIRDDKPYDLSNELCMTLTVIGDAIRNADWLLPEKPEEAMEASAARKEI